MDSEFNKDASQSGFVGESRTTGTGTATKMKQEIEDTASQVKEKVMDFGRKATDTIDAQREPAAGALDRTASTLHEQGDRLAKVTSSAAHVTADKLQATADYIREHDARAMMNDVERLMKRYPVQALAAAAVIGFLAGRVLRGGE